MDQFWSVFVRALYILFKVANKKSRGQPSHQNTRHSLPWAEQPPRVGDFVGSGEPLFCCTVELTPSMSGSCGHPWLK